MSIDDATISRPRRPVLFIFSFKWTEALEKFCIALVVTQCQKSF